MQAGGEFGGARIGGGWGDAERFEQGELAERGVLDGGVDAVAVGVEEGGSFAGGGVAEAAGRAAEPGEQRGAEQALGVDREVVAAGAEGAAEAKQLGGGLGEQAGVAEVLAGEGDGAGEGGVVGDGVEEGVLDEPIDLGIGEGRAEGGERGGGAGDVAEGRGADEEDAPGRG
ncbi:MAG: hypothetical protein AAF823_16345, partial [Planctomycetota bacterium]